MWNHYSVLPHCEATFFAFLLLKKGIKILNAFLQFTQLQGNYSYFLWQAQSWFEVCKFKPLLGALHWTEANFLVSDNENSTSRWNTSQLRKEKKKTRRWTRWWAGNQLCLFRKELMHLATSSHHQLKSFVEPHGTSSKAVLSGIRSSLWLWLQQSSDLNRERWQALCCVEVRNNVFAVTSVTWRWRKNIRFDEMYPSVCAFNRRKRFRRRFWYQM